MAEATRLHVIYGEDDRAEVFTARESELVNVRANIGILPKNTLIEFDNFYMMSPRVLADDPNLCESVRFNQQASPMLCSGVLIAPDLILTAGHCIENQQQCERMSFVFDYGLYTSHADIPIAHPKNKFYTCAELVEREEYFDPINGNLWDYAIVKLDRPNLINKPVMISLDNALTEGEELYMTGHPLGLPAKITRGGRVYLDEGDDNVFYTNLDSFQGNSGAGVYDRNTHKLQGILVRGADDFSYDETHQCYKENVLKDELDMYGPDVETVLNISQIPYLQQKQFR